MDKMEMIIISSINALAAEIDDLKVSAKKQTRTNRRNTAMAVIGGLYLLGITAQVAEQNDTIRDLKKEIKELKSKGE